MTKTECINALERLKDAVANHPEGLVTLNAAIERLKAEGECKPEVEATQSLEGPLESDSRAHHKKSKSK